MLKHLKDDNMQMSINAESTFTAKRELRHVQLQEGQEQEGFYAQL